MLLLFRVVIPLDILPFVLLIGRLVDLASLGLTVPELLGHTLCNEAVVLTVALLSEGVSANKKLVILPQNVPNCDVCGVDPPERCDLVEQRPIKARHGGVGVSQVQGERVPLVHHMISVDLVMMVAHLGGLSISGPRGLSFPQDLSELDVIVLLVLEAFR